MLCPVCRGQVSLQAAACACGFDFTTREVTLVIERARRDRWKAGLLLLAGLAGAGVCVAYGAYPYLLDAALATGFRGGALFIGLPLLTAIYGLGRSVALYRHARRRLAIADQMRSPPEARVVRSAPARRDS